MIGPRGNGAKEAESEDDKERRLGHFGSFWVIFGSFWSFWVILGDFRSFWPFWVILGHFGHFG